MKPQGHQIPGKERQVLLMLLA